MDLVRNTLHHVQVGMLRFAVQQRVSDFFHDRVGCVVVHMFLSNAVSGYAIVSPFHTFSITSNASLMTSIRLCITPTFHIPYVTDDVTYHTRCKVDVFRFQFETVTVADDTKANHSVVRRICRVYIIFNALVLHHFDQDTINRRFRETWS